MVVALGGTIAAWELGYYVIVGPPPLYDPLNGLLLIRVLLQVIGLVTLLGGCSALVWALLQRREALLFSIRLVGVAAVVQLAFLIYAVAEWLHLAFGWDTWQRSILLGVLDRVAVRGIWSAFAIVLWWRYRHVTAGVGSGAPQSLPPGATD
jgi:hypothetical protein